MAYNAGSAVMDFNLDSSQFDEEFRRIQNELREFQNSSQQSTDGLSDGLKKAAKGVATVTAVLAVAQKSMEATKKTAEVLVKVSGTLTKGFIESTKAVTEFTYKYSGIKATTDILNNTVGILGDKIKDTFNVSNIEEFADKCIELGSDLTEIQNVIDNVFKNDNTDIMNWAQNAVKKYGMSELSGRKYTSTMGAMLNSAGLSSSNVKEMSKNLSALTSDIASLYNIDYDTAFSKIRSGMAGQVRPLQEIGISLQAANLQQYLYTKGIQSSYEQLDYASKELVRYNYLIEQTRVAQGDFARTFYTWANQLRYASEQATGIMANFGQSIISIFNPVLIMLNAVLERLVQISNVISQKISEIFGDDAFGDTTQAVDVTEILDDMANTAEDTAKKTEKAIKRTVLSFDEFNKINKDDDSTSSTSQSASLNIPLLNVNSVEAKDTGQNKYYKMINDLLDRILDAWKNADFTLLGKKLGSLIQKGLNWLNDHFDFVFEFAKKLGKSVATFINGALQEIDFELLGKTFINAVKAQLYAINSFLDNLEFESIGQKIADLIKGMFSKDDDGLTFLDIFSDNISKTINGISDSLAGFNKRMSEPASKGENKLKFANNIGSAIDVYKDTGFKIAKAINDSFKEVKWDELGTNLRNVAIGILKTLATTFKSIKWADIGTDLGTLLKNLFSQDENGSSILYYLSDMAVSLINGLIDALTECIKTADLDEIGSRISEMFVTIKNSINWSDILFDAITLMDFINNLFSSAMDGVDWFAVILIAAHGMATAIIKGIPILLGAVGTVAMALAEIFIYPFEQLFENLEGYYVTLNEIFESWAETIVNSDFFKKVEESFKGLVEGIKKNFEPLKKFYVDTFNNIKKLITGDCEITIKGITDTFKSGINAVLKFVENKINFLINSINSFLGAVNKLDGINIPTIPNIEMPQLANGGYVRANMPQPVIIGDNRTQGEIVAPHDKFVEWVGEGIKETLTGSFASALQSSLAMSGGTYNITIPIYLDGEEIDRRTLKAGDIERARGGRY